MSMTCGEATMRLLARYGVTTVFGIPGVHTLDMCRGMPGGGNSAAITHVQARNEQGAGFMFTMPELLTAAEAGLSLPVVIWENGGLK